MSSPADLQVMRKDGNLEFSGGQDAGRSPSIIDRNQVAKAVNLTMRGGFLTPRPGMVKLPITFADEDTEAAFEGGRFQHGNFYSNNGRPSLLSSHGGRLFKLDLLTYQVQEISIPGDYNSSILRQGWSIQAENFWIYQDNQSKPIIYDGAATRRSRLELKEIPVGNVMAYTNGRIILALPDRVSFRAGDLLYGSTGSASDILFFKENDYLNEGGDLQARIFGAPSNYGIITSMIPTAQTDTQLGQGALLVGTPYCWFTINLPFDRTTWKNMTSALQTVVPIIGPNGQYSTIQVNGDVWYRGLDGMRSYVMARRNFNSWANTPMSAELGQTPFYDTQSLLTYGSAVLFDNRMLMTISPVMTEHGCYHRGLVSLDFDLISNINIRKNPAWEGIWTGLNFLQLVKGMVNGVERLFIYNLNPDNEIEVWEMLPRAQFDEGEKRIQWSFEGPSYNCGDSFGFKRLESGNIYIDNVAGTLDLAIKYRSDQNPCWQDWYTYNTCAKYQDCGPFDCTGPKSFQPQFRSPLNLPAPQDDFDEINGRKYRTGYEFQPRIEGTGYCQVKQVRVVAQDEPQRMNVETAVDEATA